MELRQMGAEPLSTYAAQKLLDPLASGDGFRQLFQTDVEAALAKVGCHPPVDDGSPVAWAGFCFRIPAGAALAPKEHFIEARQKLLAEFTLPMTFTDAPRMVA
jgi:putative modified peptide